MGLNLLSPKDFAELCGVNVKTVWGWIRKGSNSAGRKLRVGKRPATNHYVITKAEAEAFQREHYNIPPESPGPTD